MLIKMGTEKVALFDMDGTLADYSGQLYKDMIKIANPSDKIEPDMDFWSEGVPAYLEARRKMITRQVGWWLGLPKFKLGMDILKVCDFIGFKLHILTKGPSSHPDAWKEKVEWCKLYLRNDIGISIVGDKGLVYGRVLVDDYPEYILRWLEHRPRGLVIMPAHKYNKEFKHKNVIGYDGNNLKKVVTALQKAFDR